MKQTRYHLNSNNQVVNLNTLFCYDTSGDLVRVTAPRAGLALGGNEDAERHGPYP